MQNKKKKILIICLVILGLALVAGVTYAILYWRSQNYNININTKCFNATYTKGNNVVDGDLLLLDERDIINTIDNEVTVYNGMELTTFSTSIDNTCNINGFVHIQLDVNTINDAFTTEGESHSALKYVLARIDLDSYDNISVNDLEGDSFEILARGAVDSESIFDVYSEVLPEDGTSREYLLLFYLDGDLVNNDAGDTYFSCNVVTTAYQGTPISTYITDLYNDSTKTSVENDSITYMYDTTNNLMNDNYGNIRYYGANPNNYIWLGETYSSTYTDIGTIENEGYSDFEDCARDYGYMDEDGNYYGDNDEMWARTYCTESVVREAGDKKLYRIIGTFNNKLKVISEDYIGNYSWDTSETGINDGGWGINDWTNADLMRLLNPGFEEDTYNNSLYWNSTSGNCYTGYNNYTDSCSFNNIGPSVRVKNIISDNLWYLGATDEYDAYSDYYYEVERSYDSYNNSRPTSWVGKVGLYSLSDYGYAADFTGCDKYVPYYYEEDDDGSYYCMNNDWLKPSLKSWEWTINASLAGAVGVWNVSYDGGASSGNAFSSDAVRPVYYLNSNLIRTKGLGTRDNPYEVM